MLNKVVNCRQLLSLNFTGRSLAIMVSFMNIITVALPSPAPDDWTSNLHLSEDNRGSDTFMSAYINVSYMNKNEWIWDRSEEGRYGSGDVRPAYGVIVHVTADDNPNDHTGCQLPFRSTRSDRRLPDPGEPWVALIKRGKCNFEVKVDNAYRSFAAGVIIYNDRDSDSLDKMKLTTDSGRNISAIFTYKWKGEQLAKLVENDSKVMVQITFASQTSSRGASINRTSVLFVSITFIVLMIISLAWLVFYYVQRFRYIHAKDKLSRRLCTAAKKALSKIPTKNIKSEDKEVQGDGECCAICIEPYKISEVLRILPCTHEFHKSCIDPWLLEHRTCPMCKMDILKHYGFVFTGSQESILHMDVEVTGLDSIDDSLNSPRRVGGLSPLPQIRAVIVSEHRQGSYDNSLDGEDQSSRASTPDETTPSLSNTDRPLYDICESCIVPVVPNPNDATSVLKRNYVQQQKAPTNENGTINTGHTIQRQDYENGEVTKAV